MTVCSYMNRLNIARSILSPVGGGERASLIPTAANAVIDIKMTVR